MTAWLKMIGKSDDPLRDDWGNHAPSILQYASFAKEPGRGSFVPGDEFAYHAIGQDMSRIVAIGRVVGEGFLDDGSIEKRGWPWLIPVEIEAKRALISDGFSIDLLEADRHVPLRRAVQQKSHIVLSPREYARARALFDLA
jgi:hypothetical protein